MKTKVRDYSAVFTLELPASVPEAQWKVDLDWMQDQFNTQWGQTVGSGLAWTVTIHTDDEVGRQGPEAHKEVNA
jgi:hypothetical protein